MEFCKLQLEAINETWSLDIISNLPNYLVWKTIPSILLCIEHFWFMWFYYWWCLIVFCATSNRSTTPQNSSSSVLTLISLWLFTFYTFFFFDFVNPHSNGILLHLFFLMQFKFLSIACVTFAILLCFFIFLCLLCRFCHSCCVYH